MEELQNKTKSRGVVVMSLRLQLKAERKQRALVQVRVQTYMKCVRLDTKKSKRKGLLCQPYLCSADTQGFVVSTLFMLGRQDTHRGRHTRPLAGHTQIFVSHRFKKNGGNLN